MADRDERRTAFEEALAAVPWTAGTKGARLEEIVEEWMSRFELDSHTEAEGLHAPIPPAFDYARACIAEARLKGAI
mgnify:CR=1 FL=1